jgi:hypothetical protein
MDTTHSPAPGKFRRNAKIFAAAALACVSTLLTRAQIGTGWTPSAETYVIQTSTGCTATPLPSGIGGVFTLPSGTTGRAEFRFNNLPTTGTEQFQGDMTFNSLGGDKVNVKQTFGPAPSTPWNMIAVKKSGSGAEFYEVQNSNAFSYPYTIGTTARINTIYNPNGGGSGAATVDVYINGAHEEQVGNGTPPDYNKVGAYMTSSGSGPATVTWQNVVFWTGGSANGGTPVAVDTPAFSPPAGTYSGVQSVTLTTTTSGASIRYTTDGVTTPTETTGILYSGPVSLNASTTINAIAYKSGQTGSLVVSAAYTITGVSGAAMPTFSPGAGTYTSAQSVTISSTTSGASIAYTTDGTTPTESGGTVTHGTSLTNGMTVFINGNYTLTAIAFASGYSDSAVATGAYTILPTAAPTFNPPAGTYSSAQSVTIGSATSGAFIVYTTDGSTPTESNGTVTNGTKLTNGQTVFIGGGANSNITLKAIASNYFYQPDSVVVTGAYTILPTAAPTFNPPAGTYSSAQSVTISSATSGAFIVYTTDGSTPTESNGTVTHGTSLSNGGSVFVGGHGSSIILTAIASNSFYQPDSVAVNGVYTINLPPAPPPTFSPPAGTYSSTQSVTLSSTLDGVSFVYTTDGSVPTESGGAATNGTALFNGQSVSISATTTLKAIVLAMGHSDSSPGTAVYTFVAPIPTTPRFQGSAGERRPAPHAER